MSARKTGFKELAVALVALCCLGLFFPVREAAAATVREIREKAIAFLYREFTQKGPGNAEAGVGSYAFYLLKKAGVDAGSWKHGERSLEEAVREAIRRDLAGAEKVRAKYLVYDLLAARALGEEDLAGLLLEVLKKRQAPHGLEDPDPLSVYSNIPSYELLGRAGLLDGFNKKWAKEYLLERQCRYEGPACGSWGSGEGRDYYPDFMATAQAVRALHYLDPQGQDAEIREAIQRGLEWMKRQQRPDGCFMSGMDDPVIDTAEAVVTLKLLGIDPASWKGSQGKSAVDYLLNSALNPDGSFGACGNAMDAAWVLAACLALEGEGEALPAQPVPQERPVREGLVREVAFCDLKGHWAEKAVCRLVQMQVISGYPDGSFKPEREVSRYELAAMLVRLLKPEPVTRHDLFILSQRLEDAPDVPPWAMEAVAAALREEFMTGYPQPDGALAFKGEEAVSRVELAAVAARIIKAKCEGGVPGDLDFADTHEIPAWAREAVGVAYARGVVGGYPDGTFQPSKKVTRAEAAAVLLRLAEAIGVAK